MCLGQVISALLRLRTVQISSPTFTESTQGALARLQHLESLSISSSFNPISKQAIGTTRFPDAFPALRSLTSTSSYPFREIASFLDTYRPHNIRELVVHSCKKEEEDEWFHLFHTASMICPLLRVLDLRGASGATEGLAPDDLFSILRRPLHLTSLTLHNLPSSLLDAQKVSDVVRSLPGLRTLFLHSYTSRS